MKGAIACLPFERPKFAVVATTTTEVLVERLNRAIGESEKVINARPTEVKKLPKPVETKAVSEAQQVSAEHMKRPMTTLDTNRFRRI